MSSLKYILPVTGIVTLLLAGCQTQTNPQATPAVQATKPTTTTASKPTTIRPVDPVQTNINDGNDNGGGNDSPGGGGSGGWSG